MRRPDPRDEPVLLGLLAAYVALSSVLGLLGVGFMAEGALMALWFVFGMWVGNPLAAVVFVVGSSATGLVALGLARDRQNLASLGVGAVGTVVTYWLSYLVVSATTNMGEGGPLPGSAVEALPFVVGWGFVGIVFAAAAPLAWARWGDPRIDATRGSREGASAREVP